MKIEKNSWHYKLNSVLFRQELRQLERNTYSNSCNYINLTMASMVIIFLVLVVIALIGFLGVLSLQDLAGKYEIFNHVTNLNIYILSIIGFIFASVSILVILAAVIAVAWLLISGLPKLKNKIFNEDGDESNIVSQYIKNRKEKICSKLEFTDS